MNRSLKKILEDRFRKELQAPVTEQGNIIQIHFELFFSGMDSFKVVMVFSSDISTSLKCEDLKCQKVTITGY